MRTAEQLWALRISKRPDAAVTRPQQPCHRRGRPAGKNTAGAFVDAIGYDPYDSGLVSEGWRFQASATPYAYGAGGSFDHPQPTAARHIADLLSRARHNVK
jgi:hypothetical protein